MSEGLDDEVRGASAIYGGVLTEIFRSF